ncbi:MAG: geranylgeranyl reductase family protein [bacterium]|nr:geranylgeranyl reductase family protein [bacterium]
MDGTSTSSVPKTVDLAERREIVIVGAGPSGSAAAARLALLGRQPLLLEAKRFPRDKVCGDVLLSGIEPLLGLIDTSFDDLAVGARVLTGCRYSLDGGHRIEGRFRDGADRVRPWRILPRRLFDQRLARHAVACGAELREEHRLLNVSWDGLVNRLRVSTTEGKQWIESPLVIGADGASSRVARDRGLRSESMKMSIGLRTYAPWQDHESVVEVVARRDLLPGCCWIVPEPGGWANVGVGVLARDRRKRGLNLRTVLADTLGTRVDLQAASKPVGWQLPMRSRRHRAMGAGVLLAGDAAGFIDPFTGHGIHNAIESGIAAADVADAALATAPAQRCRVLQSHERAWRGAFAGELRLGHWLQRFNATPALLKALAAWLGSRPLARDRFMGLIGHAIPKREALTFRFLRDLLAPRV